MSFCRHLWSHLQEYINIELGIYILSGLLLGMGDQVRQVIFAVRPSRVSQHHTLLSGHAAVHPLNEVLVGQIDLCASSGFEFWDETGLFACT